MFRVEPRTMRQLHPFFNRRLPLHVIVARLEQGKYPVEDCITLTETELQLLNAPPPPPYVNIRRTK